MSINYSHYMADAGDGMAEESTMVKVVKGLIKPVLVGLAGYAIARYMNPNVGVLFFGNVIGIDTAIGISIAAGSLVATNVNSWVIDRLNQWTASNTFEKGIIAPLLTGLVAVGIMYVGNGRFTGMKGISSIAAAGVIGEAVGDYAFRNYVGNWIPHSM